MLVKLWEIACYMAPRIGKAFVMSVEDTNSWYWKPRAISCEDWSVKIQAKPVFFVIGFQAASVLQRNADGEGTGGARSVDNRGFTFVFGGWARSQSLTDFIACVMMSLGEECQFSKMRWLRAFQIPQQIQGKRLELAPIGGRVLREEDNWRSWRKELSSANPELFDQGVSLQTSAAKPQ